MIVQAVETCLGMALIYLLACLFTSSINEWIAQHVGRRGLFLDRGLQRLVPEQAIYRRLLHHPQIAALYRDEVAGGRPPSYIAPASFALALVDVVHARSFAIAGSPLPTAPLDHHTLRDAIVHLRPDHPRLAQSLLPILDRAGDDYQRALSGIEGWFSSGMDRVSGWYQARTRTLLFWLGLVLAVAGNIDSLALARNFWTTPAEWGAIDRIADRTIANGIGDGAAAGSHDALLALHADGVPLGYACAGEATIHARAVRARCIAAVHSARAADILLKLIGWLLTALAISLGAPFWFEALSRIVSLRASGPAPVART